MTLYIDGIEIPLDSHILDVRIEGLLGLTINNEDLRSPSHSCEGAQKHFGTKWWLRAINVVYFPVWDCAARLPSTLMVAAEAMNGERRLASGSRVPDSVVVSPRDTLTSILLCRHSLHLVRLSCRIPAVQY